MSFAIPGAAGLCIGVAIAAVPIVIYVAPIVRAALRSQEHSPNNGDVCTLRARNCYEHRAHRARQGRERFVIAAAVGIRVDAARTICRMETQGQTAQGNGPAHAETFEPLITRDVAGSGPLPPAPSGITIDDLLKPSSSDRNCVQFGSVNVPNELRADFEKAWRYLAQDHPEAVAALYLAEHSPKAIDVLQSAYSNDDEQHEPLDPVTGYGDSGRLQIDWDPRGAALLADGSTQSPAQLLGHEFGHAIEDAYHPDRLTVQAGELSSRHTQAEEQRNITGFETRLSLAHGEGIRLDHAATPFEVAGVTDRTPVAMPVLPPADAMRHIKALSEGEKSVFNYSTPPPAADASHIKPFDGQANHTGSILHLDGNTVAQYTGRGEYVLYDVKKDLHGQFPPEHMPNLTIDRNGRFEIPPAQQERLLSPSPER